MSTKTKATLNNGDVKKALQAAADTLNTVTGLYGLSGKRYSILKWEVKEVSFKSAKCQEVKAIQLIGYSDTLKADKTPFAPIIIGYELKEVTKQATKADVAKVLENVSQEDLTTLLNSLLGKAGKPTTKGGKHNGKK